MKSQIVWYFSDEYTLEFLGYDPFCSENVLFFFLLHGGFLHIPLFIIGMLQALFFQIFNVPEFLDVHAKFLN